MRSGVVPKFYVVLLVEGDTDVRELYGNAMRSTGLLVNEVVMAIEARELAARLGPDIIVLDRRLPDGDGWDVARALKADEKTRHVPIVAFTSHRERSDVESALVAGCDVFVEKGCPPETLVSHVRGMLALPHRGRSPAPAEEAASVRAGSRSL